MASNKYNQRFVLHLVQLLVSVTMILNSATPVIAMAIPQDIESVNDIQTELAEDISSSMQIGSDTFLVPQEPVANFEESQPPAEEILLSYMFLSAEPQLLLGKQPITISWELQDVTEANYEIQINLPEGLTLKDKDFLEDNPISSSIVIAKNEPIGSVDLKVLDLENAPYKVTLSAVSNGEVILENIVTLNEPLHGNIDKDIATEKESADNRVKITIPPGLAKKDFALDFRPPAPNVGLPYSLSGYPFEVLAVDTADYKNLTKFEKSFTLQVKYEEDKIFNWSEEDISLFYFDEEKHGWHIIETIVDTEANTLTAQVDHLTTFDYGIDSWEAPLTPTISAAQTSQFTGAATYAIDFWVPQGPGGTQPSLSLNYSSAVVDNASAFSQASWVGAGWSLDTGYIKRNMNGTNTNKGDDTFSLVMGGISGMLLPIDIEVDGHWTTTTYSMESEQFYLIQSRHWVADDPIEWIIKDKTGKTYIFADLARNNFSMGCAHEATDGLPDVWQWSLSSVEDQFGNIYTYEYDKGTRCDNEIAVYPSHINYPGITDTYRVSFNRIPRSDYQTDWTWSSRKAFFSKERLYSITVELCENGYCSQSEDWDTIRSYVFTYTNQRSEAVLPGIGWTAGGITNTLIGIQEFDAEGNAMPATSFTYGDYLHLTEIDNGQNGVVEFVYERWQYQGEDLNEGMELSIEYGIDRDECTNHLVYTTEWIEKNSSVYCHNGDLSLRQYVEEWNPPATGVRHLPVAMIKPGADILMEVWAYSYNLTDTDKELFYGIAGKTRDYSTGELTAFTEGETYTLPAKPVTIPDEPMRSQIVTIPVETDVLYFDASWFTHLAFRFSSYQAKIDKHVFRLLPQYYRVIEQTITDTYTGVSHSYQFEYDGGAVNDSLVSEFSADALIEDENGDNTLDELWTEISTEFRGNSFVRQTYTQYDETSPSPVVTTSWYHQDDYLQGNMYRTFTAEEDFYLEVPGVGAGWTTWYDPSLGHSIEQAYYAGDDALMMSNSQGQSFTYLSRTDDYVQDEEYVYFQFMVSEQNTIASYILVNTNGGTTPETVEEIGNFGFAVNGTGLSYQFVNNTGYTTGSLGPTDFIQVNHPYMAMFFVDNDDKCHIRVWDMVNPSTSYEVSDVAARVPAAQTAGPQPGFQFRAYSFAGTAWLDAYSQGKPFSETINKYDYTILYDSIEFGDYDDIASPYLLNGETDLYGFSDLFIATTELTSSISRQFEGDYSWNGTKTEYTYDSRGNVTQVLESSGSSSDPDFSSYILTVVNYPTSSSNNIYGVPIQQTVYDCVEVTGTCSASNGARVSETRMYYDAGFTQYPADGYLSRTRTLIGADESDNDIYIQVEQNYDDYGNITSTTQYSQYAGASISPPSESEISPAITTTYDTTYNTYPAVVTYNSLPGSPTIETEYDLTTGQPKSVSDLNGNKTYAKYDGFGRQTAIYAPGDYTVTYDENNNEIISGIPTLQIAYYDVYIDLEDPENSNPIYHINLQQKVDNGTSIRASRFYNGFGQIIQTQQVGTYVGNDQRTVITDITYDIFGNILTQTVPYVETEYCDFSSTPSYCAYGTGQSIAVTNTYDIFGRLTTATGVNQVSVSYAYDDLKTSVTDGNNVTTHTFSDVWGNVTRVDEVIDPDIEYTYDVLGLLTKAQLVTGNTVVNEVNIYYDNLGRKISMSDPDMGDWSYEYDTLGNLVEQTDARDCITKLTYDALNRLTEKTYSGCVDITTPSINYSYDETSYEVIEDNNTVIYYNKGLGLRTGMTDESGSTHWIYDNRGRLVQEDKTITGYSGGTLTTLYAYNSADMVTVMTYPDGEEVTNTYSNGGQLTQIDTSTDMSTYVSDITYDVAGRIASLDYGMDVNDNSIVHQTYAYHDWNEVAKGGLLSENLVENNDTLSPVVMHLKYTGYDSNGNILTIENEVDDENTTLTYDNLNRLISMLVEDGTNGDDLHKEAFTYDSTTGNLDTKQMVTEPTASSTPAPVQLTYDSTHPHAVAGYDGNTYEYDANGNQTTRDVDGIEYTLDYDHENRLVSVSTPTSFVSGTNDTEQTENLTITGTPPTETPTPESTPTLTGTPPTATPSPSATPIPSNTLPPTSTPSLVPTNTPTETSVPSETPITPTNTPTETSVPSETPTTPTNTPPTPTGTGTPIPSETPEQAGDPPTQTPTLTGTLPTETLTVESTDTPTLTPITPTTTQTPPPTTTPTATQTTPTMSPPPTETLVASPTASLTPSSTAATLTPTPTDSATATFTPTILASDIPDGLSGAQSTTLSSPVSSASYTYDGDGNMVKSVVGDVTTYYVGGYYEIQEETVEIESSPTLVVTQLKYYIGPTGRFAMRELVGTIVDPSDPTPTPAPTTIGGENSQQLNVISNELYWIFSDHLQSSSVILEEDGDVFSKTFYTAFGEVRENDDPTLSESPTDYQYTGQRSYLDSLGLHYYVARWYDPQTAHFTQADTIIPNPGNSGDWDRYAYVLNNPMNLIDPSGHWEFPPKIPPFIYDFAWGYLKELASISSGGAFSTNNPYKVTPYESIPSYAGRIFADYLAFEAGLLMFDVGVPMIGGGAAACVGSEGVLCPAGAGVAAVGALLASAGVSVMGISGAGAVQAGAGLIKQAYGNVSQNEGNSTSLERIFEPSPRHESGGPGSPMDLSDDVAQQVLDDGIQHGGQIWSVYDDQVYVFQNNNSGTWHGYNITGQEKPPTQVMKAWRQDNVITNSYYNKMTKWPERGH